MVYCCLSSIPTSNAEGCLRTYQERGSPNGSAVCFPTTGTAHWVRGSLGIPSFFRCCIHRPKQTASEKGLHSPQPPLPPRRVLGLEVRGKMLYSVKDPISLWSLSLLDTRWTWLFFFIDLKVVETLVGIGELNSSSLQEWYALLTAEPSLQSQHDCYQFGFKGIIICHSATRCNIQATESPDKLHSGHTKRVN